MAATQAALVVLQKALPALAKQLPKLWPLLLDSKNRDKVTSLLSDLGNASPRRRLAGRMQATELLAETLTTNAETDEERQQAAEWQSRARKMRARLDMPVLGAQAKRAHRKALKEDLTRLHQEMSDALRE